LESLVRSDHAQVAAARHLGMVCFRLCGENELTEKLLKKLNSGGQLHCVPASLCGRYVIRFTVTSQYTTAADIAKDWSVIRAVASKVLEELKEQPKVVPGEAPITSEARAKVRLAGEQLF
jgi:histidine decarboxylase